jgi:hypothetical protein
MLRKCLFKTRNRIDLLIPDLKNDFKPPTKLKIPAKITKKYKTMKLIILLLTVSELLELEIPIEMKVANPKENKI